MPFPMQCPEMERPWRGIMILQGHLVLSLPLPSPMRLYTQGKLEHKNKSQDINIWKFRQI